MTALSVLVTAHDSLELAAANRLNSNSNEGSGSTSPGPLFLSPQSFREWKALGNSVNSARTRSYAGGYGPVGPGPIGPGLGGFLRITLRQLGE
jgi:hypothetical protein